MNPLSIVTYTAVMAALVYGTVTDIKKREVPDLLNYGLIFFGISARLLYSVVYSDYIPLWEGLIGLVIFIGLSCAMFYTGQWGGGDAKLLMGMGSVLGVELGVFRLEVFPIMATFVINLMIVGAIYGVGWSLIIGVKNFPRVKEEFLRLRKESNVIFFKRAMIAIGLLGFGASFFVDMYMMKTALIVMSFVLVSSVYMWIIVKSVEKACMYKYVAPSKLTEGDWIAEDVFYKKKYICGPKDLGIEMDQIKLLKKHKIKEVLVRDGIPFVPSFLVGFIVTLLYGAWFLQYVMPF